MGVAIGVDSHKSSLAVGVLDEVGRTVGVSEFANDRRGHASLIEWIDRCGPERVIGIEGAGNYGAVLARRLLQAGEDVREVPAFLSHRERKKNPSRGKSDVNDAIAIARKSLSRLGREHSDQARQRPDVRAHLQGLGIDLLVFPAPGPLAFEAGLPSIMAIHDLQHRLQPEFPEVIADGEFEVCASTSTATPSDTA